MQDVSKGVTQLSSVLDMGYSSIMANILFNMILFIIINTIDLYF